MKNINIFQLKSSKFQFLKLKKSLFIALANFRNDWGGGTFAGEGNLRSLS